MPFYLRPGDDTFPPVDSADEDGLLAVGGDLRPARLLRAYAEGIFPWYGEGLPILWHSPDPRMVLRATELHVGRSLERRIRRGDYDVRLDTAFARVIEGCADAPRAGQAPGTWITADMVEAYCELHERGFAHSAEAWAGAELVGGLYGVCLGGVFFGESMFAAAPDASKVAFVTLVRKMATWGIGVIDCQTHTDHLARFGATMWPRREFLKVLEQETQKETKVGKWTTPP